MDAVGAVHTEHHTERPSRGIAHGAPMDALPLMAAAATGLRERLMEDAGVMTLPVPDAALQSAWDASAKGLRWDNTLLAAKSYRRAHVETLIVPGRVAVLHVCVFPHLDDPAPIFGFDMIAGHARVTGIFLDLSPVLGRAGTPRLGGVLEAAGPRDFAAYRDLPDWGDIFSSDVLAIRPVDLDEVARAIALAEHALDTVLTTPRERATDRPTIEAIGAGQARYIAGQRRNEHTPRMLAGLIGPAKARAFIDEVLFPQVPATNIARAVTADPAASVPARHEPDLDHTT